MKNFKKVFQITKIVEFEIYSKTKEIEIPIIFTPLTKVDPNRPVIKVKPSQLWSNVEPSGLGRRLSQVGMNRSRVKSAWAEVEPS